ncbi:MULTISPECIES: SAV_915 family protein [unclassified Streptomyces]|uniref:SAV_915 family protein n=1 Tax=unclassified Streptomyces TaxID=2593676 RepID=UPI002034C461|nr:MULTISPECIES: SAV_915 family protein [unclassified Streptomyces]
MTAILSGEDPEPSDRFPAGPLYVPVRPGPAACAARLFRTPLGGRTAVGFTSLRQLTATLGPDQPWIRLAEPALRALTAPLGLTTVTVDPPFCAPPPTAPSAVEHTEHMEHMEHMEHAEHAEHTEPRFGPGRHRTARGPQAVGAPRVTGAAALISASAAPRRPDGSAEGATR